MRSLLDSFEYAVASSFVMNMSSSLTASAYQRFRILAMTAFLLLIHHGGNCPVAAATASSTAPRLVGTVEGAPFAGAVFDDGTGVQTFYRLHEQLPDGSYITKVRNDSILIKKADGGLYEMFTTGTANSTITAVPSPAVSPARPQSPAPGTEQQRIRTKGRLGRAPAPEE